MDEQTDSRAQRCMDRPPLLLPLSPPSSSSYPISPRFFSHYPGRSLLFVFYHPADTFSFFSDPASTSSSSAARGYLLRPLSSHKVRRANAEETAKINLSQWVPDNGPDQQRSMLAASLGNQR